MNSDPQKKAAKAVEDFNAAQTEAGQQAGEQAQADADKQAAARLEEARALAEEQGTPLPDETGVTPALRSVSAGADATNAPSGITGDPEGMGSFAADEG